MSPVREIKPGIFVGGFVMPKSMKPKSSKKVKQKVERRFIHMPVSKSGKFDPKGYYKVVPVEIHIGGAK